MVNTLSGSVSAYRKEIVKPRFIRIDEVMALLDVTRDEAMDIALAAGARYQLAKDEASGRATKMKRWQSIDMSPKELLMHTTGRLLKISSDSSVRS